MPYAGDGMVSTDPIAGGIEITDSEYSAALDAMQCGLHVAVKDGRLDLAPPPEPAPDPAPPPLQTHETPIGDAEIAAARAALDALVAAGVISAQARSIMWPPSA